MRETITQKLGESDKPYIISAYGEENEFFVHLEEEEKDVSTAMVRGTSYKMLEPRNPKRRETELYSVLEDLNMSETEL